MRSPATIGNILKCPCEKNIAGYRALYVQNHLKHRVSGSARSQSGDMKRNFWFFRINLCLSSPIKKEKIF
jgi:hypothetical protein